jgi:hypothetical protein
MAWHDTDMQRSSLVNDEAEMASALPRKALDPDAPPVQVVDPVSDPLREQTVTSRICCPALPGGHRQTERTPFFNQDMTARSRRQRRTALASPRHEQVQQKSIAIRRCGGAICVTLSSKP